MEIILLKEVDKLGYEGDIVQVKPGFARNYLVPNKLAVIATPSSKKRIDELNKQIAHKLEKSKNDALDKAAKLEKASIIIPAKTGTSGKIFGSVTSIQIANELNKQGFDVERKKIILTEEVKTLGTFTATIKIHKEVDVTITFEVVAADAPGEL